MCGIFGYIGEKENAGNIVHDGLKTLEYRGYDSWGVAILAGSTIEVTKDIGKITDSRKSFKPSHIALGHTRWATHGNVTQVNAHPHLDCSGKLAIIHNGIIENYAAIKEELTHQGHTFLSGTDTEVAVHLIEEKKKNGNTFCEAVRKAFNQFEGLNAIIVLDEETQSFIAAKNGSPIVIGKGKGENFIASDVPALIQHTQDVHFMEDGEIIEIHAKNVHAYSLKDGREKPLPFQTIHWRFDEISLGNFPHFMLKEIYEQPKVIKTIVSQNDNSITDLATMIKHAHGTYFVACGSASYAANAGVYLFSKVAKRHVNFAIGSEFGYQLDFLTDKSLVIALSQSGETIDVIDAVKRAREKGAKIYALVNALGSTLYRMADYKILLMAGPEKAVASTKAFTAKLAYLILLAYAVAGRLPEGKKYLSQSIEAMESILKNEIPTIKKIAKKIVNSHHVFAIGRGLAYPIALEAALKIKEISYIHAEGLPSGELKHGTIALVEKGTPCIAFLPNDETYGANLVGAMEMKARGGYIIGISHTPHEVFDYYIPVSDCREASIIPQTMIVQLLAYFLAVEKDLDPDKPRNLAKSVTVR